MLAGGEETMLGGGEREARTVGDPKERGSMLGGVCPRGWDGVARGSRARRSASWPGGAIPGSGVPPPPSPPPRAVRRAPI